jgi:hypothetical protein
MYSAKLFIEGSHILHIVLIEFDVWVGNRICRLVVSLLHGGAPVSDLILVPWYVIVIGLRFKWYVHQVYFSTIHYHFTSVGIRDLQTAVVSRASVSLNIDRQDMTKHRGSVHM